MAAEFKRSVEYGLSLSKRIYYGKGMKPPGTVPAMTRSQESYLPTAQMVYAMIYDPAMVDNPDVPSYQPYVHGRYDPPALIPLQMHGVTMEVECYLDTAVVTVAGIWRLHCVMAGRKCDCLVAIPTGEQGLLLGVEVDVPGKLYNSQLINMEDMKDNPEAAKAKDGSFLKFQTFTLRVPQVSGGSTLSIKAKWSQKLMYRENEFCLSVPFSFPAYVCPVVKKKFQKEKIQLNINFGTGTEVICSSATHPLKEVIREAGQLGFVYEAEAKTWSSNDFQFCFSVSSNEISGYVFLQNPPSYDFDQRENFLLYLYPGKNQIMKVFRREVVYIMDISGSMEGDLMTIAKNVLLESISKLNHLDSFNIIAFNDEVHLFSSSMEPVTNETISNATEWISNTFKASGGTNILQPLEKAMNLLADATDSIPLIFLVTDGTVENEREICNRMKDHLSRALSLFPRICTFGIGTYCNHYFLQMLAQIGRGRYDAAYDAESLDCRMQRFFTTASSIIAADIYLDALENLESFELFPSHLPDLSLESPLVVSGKYTGKFPEDAKVGITLADSSIQTIELQVHDIKDMPLEKVYARRQIDILTAQAWLGESRQLEQKVARMSIQFGIPSEYTCMNLLETSIGKTAPESAPLRAVYDKIKLSKKADPVGQKILFLGSLGKGFGDLIATAKNFPPGVEQKPQDAAQVLVSAASNCCSRLMDRCCCMCFIQTCSYLNDQCTIVLTQLCAALACFECINCCFDLFDNCT